MIKQNKWTFIFVFTALLAFNPFNLFSATSQTELGFTNIAKKATPAVVSIKVKIPVSNKSSLYHGRDGSQSEDPFEFFCDSFFEGFFKQPRKKSSPKPILKFNCVLR